MTTLQKAIAHIKKEIEDCIEPKPCKMCELDKLNVSYLESLLPDEEQQIRDAWRAAADRYHNDHYGPIPNPYPDLDTYLTNLIQQP